MSEVPITISAQAEQESEGDQILKFSIYALQGVLLVTTNFTILATIMKHKLLRMRKEYILVGGLCFTDGMNGFATLFAGLGRIHMLMAEGEIAKVSRWECFLKPWNLIWSWNDPLVGVMLLVISVDRLLAVLVPFRYFKFGSKYGYYMVGGVHIWMFTGSAIMLVLAYEHQYAEWPELCISAWAFPKEYYMYYQLTLKIWSGIFSVLIYVAVVILSMIKRKPTQVNPDRKTKSSAEVAYWRQQRRLTTTLGLSSLFTLFLFVIPCSIDLYISYSDWSAAAITLFVPYTFILNNLNPMANFFLYTLRHREIRLGFKCLFTGKQLTPVMLANGVSRVDVAEVLPMEDITH